jgi:hypothetical protein
MSETRNAWKIWVEKSTYLKKQGDEKQNIPEICRRDGKWEQLTQDRVQLRPSVVPVLNHRILLPQD